MADAQSRGWGAPCSGGVVTLVRADGLRLPVRAELADLTSMLLDLTELGGYDVKPGQTWGRACRKIAGTSTWSNHAWGLAVDVNAPSNPYASADWHRRNARGTRPFGLAIVCDIPQTAIEMWEAHGFRFGGRYKSKPDPMHLEFMGTPADAAAHTRRLRAYLADHGQPAPQPPAPKPNTPPPPDGAWFEETIALLPTLDLRNAAATPIPHAMVDQLQGLLLATRRADCNPGGIDGIAGGRTLAAVTAFQRFRGLAADGIVGPATWRNLILY